MRLEIKVVLEDVRQAGERVAQFTAHKSMSDYVSDALLRAGVERQFEIIGEALSRLRKFDSATLARLTDHARIISFRNVLIHAYDRVDDRVVWDIVQQHLPRLMQEVTGLLNEP